MNVKMIMSSAELMKAAQTYINGIYGYYFNFMTPFWIALNSFLSMEKIKFVQHKPDETSRDYLDLLHFNLQITKKGLLSTLRTINDFHAQELERSISSLLNTLFDRKGEDISAYTERLSRLTELLTYHYPQVIRDIEPEFGFHFDDGNYIKVAETDRFYLYQVLPRDKKIKVREEGKPIIIIPPYVLGASILAFLPGEDKSYTHCFANQGIPTYIRIMKDFNDTPAVQTITGENDCLDTRHFCEIIKTRHGRPVTLNGFCQGGFSAVLNLLTGGLDGLVDAFITCVAPMDGTRSKALVEYLEHIPERFRDLGYALKTLPNGNRVVDGKVMSWVYKLKSMDREAPIFTFYRDLMMFDKQNAKEIEITKTAAALNYWLVYERNDLPLAITQMSFDSYTKPVNSEGILPVKLFGRELNFTRLKEMKIKWLLCCAEEDDLVDRESALAPLDFVDAEVTVFPKGHGAIATSWSLPTSEYALHKRFKDGSRGPVRFQLDLDKERK
ncbi:MAG: metal transporter [Deltaproteobacteria bacterium]|nr:metal transporter [Deltaproteobacteria bacterium]